MSIAGLAGKLRSRFGWEGPAAPNSVPALILLAGLPGTGKSYLAAAIAERHPVAVVRSDEVRKAIFEQPQYTGAESGIVYLTCYALLAALLADGYTAAFDATNLARNVRGRARKIAEQAGAPSLTVLTVAQPAVVTERLRRRASGELEPFSSDADWQVYQQLARSMEPANPANEEESVIVDTSQGIETALRVVDQFLEGAKREGRGAV
ncbi:MAG: AAA family ATPase [Chloroflexota bacterium]